MTGRREGRAIGAITILFTMQDGAYGGVAGRVLQVARGLTARGHRCVIALPLGAEATRRFRAAGLLVEEVPYLRIHRVRNPLYYLAWALAVPVTAIALLRVIRRHRVDVVYDNQTTQIQSALAARLAGSGLVWHLIGMHEPDTLERAFFPVVRMTADRIVVSSEARGQRSRRINRYRGPYTVIHAPVDVERFHPRGAEPRDTVLRAALGAGPDEVLIGAVCAINRSKGVDLFVEAAAEVVRQVPEARFVVVGPAVPTQREYHERMLALRERLGLEGRFAFAGARDDVPEVMRALDLFVLPSVSESSPMVVLEAMASGLAVVAANVGGVAEMLDDGSAGVICEAGDAALLAAALTPLARDPAARERLGRAARERSVDCFRTEVALDRAESVIRSSMRGRSR